MGVEPLVRHCIGKPAETGRLVLKLLNHLFTLDFVVTGATRELLTDGVIPKVEKFLRERGLELSHEKSTITHIEEGFNFLGFNIRKYRGKLLTKPSKESIKSFLEEIRKTIKTNKTAKQENLIRLLNPKISGWANYFRHSVSSRAFSYIDHHIDKVLYNWVRRRHPSKSVSWRRRKYYRTKDLRHGIFTARIRNTDSSGSFLDIIIMSTIAIKRHIKIRAAATPYDPIFKEYFQWRSRRKTRS